LFCGGAGGHCLQLHPGGPSGASGFVAGLRAAGATRLLDGDHLRGALGHSPGLALVGCGGYGFGALKDGCGRLARGNATSRTGATGGSTRGSQRGGWCSRSGTVSGDATGGGRNAEGRALPATTTSQTCGRVGGVAASTGARAGNT